MKSGWQYVWDVPAREHDESTGRCLSDNRKWGLAWRSPTRRSEPVFAYAISFIGVHWLSGVRLTVSEQHGLLLWLGPSRPIPTCIAVANGLWKTRTLVLDVTRLQADWSRT